MITVNADIFQFCLWLTACFKPFSLRKFFKEEKIILRISVQASAQRTLTVHCFPSSVV
jgi:hypothetical protein